ncbi:MAG: hypothetical protein K0Q59_1347 [Paenibacillus sp.]|nr:hypothetical protein [Paenibacillus sp.]
MYTIVHQRGGVWVARMFRVLGFWTLAIGLMALAGDMREMALLFFFQTAAFVVLGYMNLTERTYITLFWGYMILSFLGFTYWSFFQMSV